MIRHEDVLFSTGKTWPTNEGKNMKSARKGQDEEISEKENV